MKSFLTIIAVICFLNLTTKAQFTGYYSAGNWTTISASDGYVDSTNKPNSITVIGSDLDNGIFNPLTEFTIVAAASGAWSFDWAFSSDDGSGGADPAYVIINGVPSLLSNNEILNPTGNFAGSVNIGDVIGFRIDATDDCCGRGFLTISNFVAPGGVLPVKLTSFTAKLIGKKIQLDWLTASETNSDRYEIERSADGKNFEKIGTLKAGGNSAIARQYTYTDMAPVNNANYYRLRMVDIDAKSMYSKTAVVKFANTSSVYVYPNPAKDIVTINIVAAGVSKTETISLYNIQGKLLETRKVSLQTSNNTIQWNVSKLAAGQYYFKVGSTATPLSFVKNL